MHAVNFEAILTKKHHYWRNLLILLFIVLIIAAASSWYLTGQSTVNLCAGFSPVAGEVTCEQAVNLALAEYPGEAYEVNRAKSQTKEFWIIDINGEDRAEVFVDTAGNIMRIAFPEG